MVKHIVMWKLKETAEGASKAENLKTAQAQLEALTTKIPELNSLEVGIDFNRSAAAYDIVLVTEFESREALEAYQNHPEHRKVADFIGKIRQDRAVVDYEI
ncbi:stress responsive alpha-beta barrel domain protein [Candidatus Vecturithrix granuli]|uniref:Stress responsive alpha-beta barrel domain protein n=1 Tax=Vecturithrix granuli TaxID=1499967 RepID=A0A081CAS6_VECG1|nr:stress responsive alpha-beta barrel domain protein [Candidatus Vecturithrix granuli]